MTGPGQSPSEPDAGHSRRMALFDFDGTLCTVNSYQEFLRWALRQPNAYAAKILLGLALRRARLIRSATLKNLALGRLRGFSRTEVEQLGKVLYREKIRPRLAPEAIAELLKRQQERYLVVIVSGAFDFMLAPFCQEHQIDQCYSARVAFAGETCLGRLEAGEMRGEEKLICLRHRFPESEMDWPGSCAYGDEVSDLALLNAVGHPFAVGALCAQASELPAHFQKLRWK